MPIWSIQQILLINTQVSNDMTPPGPQDAESQLMATKGVCQFN